MARPAPPPGEADLSGLIGPGAGDAEGDDDEAHGAAMGGGMMLPRGVAKGRKKEEPVMDLFGLCTYLGLPLRLAFSSSLDPFPSHYPSLATGTCKNQAPA